jgi:hypothetical protein
VIGLDLGEVESEAFWTEFLRAVRARGLQGLRLVISDHQKGLQTAIARVLDAPWQRCTVHFVRNMHGHCRPAQRGLVSAALREVFNATDRAEASRRLTDVLARLASIAPKICQLLEQAEEDLLAFMAFPPEHWSKLRSTNRLSASTVKSGAARTSSASSPTTPRNPPGWRSADRTERRVDRLPPLPLRRVHARDPPRRHGPRGLSLTDLRGGGSARSLSPDDIPDEHPHHLTRLDYRSRRRDTLD